MNNKEFIKEAFQLNEDIHTFTIDVQVDFEPDIQFLEDVKVRPILVDGEIDQQALGDYLAFVLEALSELDDAGLEVIEQHDSKSSETSKYFTLADEGQYKNGDMKYIIYLRISDHVLNLNKDQKKILKQKRIDDSSKLKVKWKVRQIMVNNEIFSTYDEAVEYVGKKALEYKNSLNNNN